MNNHLDKLKKRYAGKDAFDICNPDFRRVAEQIFPDASTRQTWAFDHIATFLDLPYYTQENWAEIDVGIAGIPVDIGVTHRAGTRFGPRALRNTERIGPYDHVLNVAPATLLKAADLGDIPLRNRFDISDTHADIEKFVASLLEADVLPLLVGGDHSVTLPVLRAIGRTNPVGLIHFDAHCDTAGLFYGNQHQGSPFRQAVLEGLIEPSRCVQIGIRGPDEYFWEFSKEAGMTVIHAEDVFEQSSQTIVEKIISVVGEGPVYVTVDIDALDPSCAPGTGTPEVNGLYPRELFSMLRGLKGLNIVGGDIVEVAPQYDPTTNTAQLGGQILFTLLCLAALRFR
ncbi:agmatinase [Pectobacterium polaris]|uniref:agmatinase n=1 Tax=Pectobacterium polaris TaxID=2042057 RepID=UPI001582FC24|nr:agmatinase [Pectobacterium polaris]